ncbi:molluscan insulin-related peptide 1-like [Stylophora pistillata]|nr:molluscan insulin-related peptide 1-like [Stylophora pistillata]
MEAKFVITISLLALMADLPGTKGRRCERCKVNEASPLPVDFSRLCGDSIITVFDKICSVSARRGRKRDMSTDLFVQTKNEAQDYLSYQRRKRGGGTNIYEDCCGERCRIEEIKEYC